MRRIPSVIAMFALFLPAANAQDVLPQDLDALGWLTGAWLGESGEETSEHIWTSVRGGTLLGLQRDIRAGADTWVEFVRLHETPDGIVFTAVPLGQAQTDFLLVESGPHHAVFENPGHDYPQRVVYRREGDILIARIEGLSGGKPRASEWRWNRVQPGGD
ncbi:MAG TPA: DUF6265 family protein [Gammaproteobacteria bacterium]|nr:DUF6265 family protein [Gammaproteobacteria bacterium]